MYKVLSNSAQLTYNIYSFCQGVDSTHLEMATSGDKPSMGVSEFRSVYESEGQYNLTVQIPY